MKVLKKSVCGKFLGANVLKEARKGFFLDVVFAKRLKITKKDI